MNGLKNVLLAAAIALLLGVGTGYKIRGYYEASLRVESAQEARQETAEGIQESIETSRAIEDQADAVKAQVTVVRKIVRERLATKEQAHVQTAPDIHCSGRLDVGTVRLLDAARQGIAPDTAGLGDAESQAPSHVGLPELIDNDLQVVELYHDLATRHDALVDWVETLLKKQASE